MIRPQVSLITRVGLGKEAPGREPRICQITNSTHRMMSGGSTRDAKPRPAASSPSGSARGAGVRAVARRIGSRVSDAFMRILDFEVLARSSGGLDVLDVQAVEVLLGVRRIKHLAVEELLDAARSGGGDVLGGDAEFLRRHLPQVFAVDLGDQ